MATTVLYNPLIGEQFEVGDKLYVYEAGTTTPITTYQDGDLSTTHASPVVADSTGRFAAIFVNSNVGDIKITVTDSLDVERYTVDDVPVTDTAALSASISTLNTQYTSLNGRLTTAESEVDTLQTESTDYESRITSLEGATAPFYATDLTDNQSIGTSGYWALPTATANVYFVHQWIRVARSGSDMLVTYPLALDAAPYNIQCTSESTANSNLSGEANVGSTKTATQCNIRTGDSTTHIYVQIEGIATIV